MYWKRGDLLSFGGNVRQCAVNLCAYWVLGTISTKNKIDSFFTDTLKFEKESTTIVVESSHLFTLEEYRKGMMHCTMLAITKQGAKLISCLCDKLETESEIHAMLSHYFDRRVAYQYPDVMSHLLRILPLLVQHYYSHRRGETALYVDEKFDGRYLCIMYPVTNDLLKGLGALMHAIALSKEDRPTRDKIYLS